ncbi:MAG: energy-coupling factor transporter transmembrane component T family protein [Anaerolineae bacterium]
MAQVGAPGVQPRGRKWVRSFLFAVPIHSPLARLHLISKSFAVLALSGVIMHTIRTRHPDPWGALGMMILALLGLFLSGVLRWVFRSYLLVIFPGLVGMALVWVIFSPSLGGKVLLRIPLYSGTLSVGMSVRWGILIACVVGWVIWRREIFWGLVAGLVFSTLATSLLGNPAVIVAQFRVYHPLQITVTEQNLIVALTKALGYGAMMLLSLLLLMTSRDVEIIGAMRQFRVPYVASFFVVTMLRSLSMALLDYRTIRQAQFARGIGFRRKNVLQTVADLASMAVPLIAMMMRRSSEVGDAALIRGFSIHGPEPAEFHEIRPLTRVDWLVIGGCAVLLVGVVVFRVNLTRWVGGWQ